MVNPSPWPFVASLAVLILAIGAVLSMHAMDHWLLLAGILALGITLVGWWRDVIKESNEGFHTQAVQLGLKIGMGLFIASEVMFFIAFGGYFYSALDPKEATGFIWPPKSIKPLDPFEWPYLNTLILLLSGTSVTWSHHALSNNKMAEAAKGLAITIILGLVFLCIQIFEYHHANFSFQEGIYPSLFYMVTGFHGFHVIAGTVFLAVCWGRLKRQEFTAHQHVGFETAAWYWHFVDVVWLFLFISIYWWGYQPCLLYQKTKF